MSRQNFYKSFNSYTYKFIIEPYFISVFGGRLLFLISSKPEFNFISIATPLFSKYLKLVRRISG